MRQRTSKVNMGKFELNHDQHFFDINHLMECFYNNRPEIINDLRMIDEPAASCRLVRIYIRLPLHTHSVSDENVYIVQGWAKFQLGDETRVIGPDMFIHFPKNTPHAVLEIIEEPLVTLTIDTPRRPEADVHFLENVIEPIISTVSI